MITCEHSQAARSDRERLMKTELRREIGYGLASERWGIFLRPRLLVRYISLERAQYLAHVLRKIWILQASAEFRIRNFVQDGNGIVVKVLPPAWGEFLENLLRPLLPSPPNIPSQFIQAHRQFGQFVAGQRLLRHK